jgi:hypothetical protein
MLVATASFVGRKERMWHRIESGRSSIVEDDDNNRCFFEFKVVDMDGAFLLRVGIGIDDDDDNRCFLVDMELSFLQQFSSYEFQISANPNPLFTRPNLFHLFL